MKTLKLIVTILGGRSEYGITYRLYKRKDLIIGERKEKSFEKTFTDLEGRYQLFIYGPLPISDKGKVKVELIYTEGEIEIFQQISSGNPFQQVKQQGLEIDVDYYFQTLER